MFNLFRYVLNAGSGGSRTNPNKQEEEFLCALSGQLLEDPVCVEDEPRFTYERRFIVKWFDECRARNRPLTSPMTRKEVGDSLVPNTRMKEKIEQTVASSGVQNSKKQINHNDARDI
jgi:hypothetical protein